MDKILIPVVIVAIIAGIYFIKNAGKTPAAAPQTSVTSGAVDYNSAEFDLDATKNLDMESSCHTACL